MTRSLCSKLLEMFKDSIEYIRNIKLDHILDLTGAEVSLWNSVLSKLEQLQYYKCEILALKYRKSMLILQHKCRTFVYKFLLDILVGPNPKLGNN